MIQRILSGDTGLVKIYGCHDKAFEVKVVNPPHTIVIEEKNMSSSDQVNELRNAH